MKVITFSNLKGGVGKTTLTILLSVFLSQILRYRVLLIDTDYQKSLTRQLLPDGDTDGRTDRHIRAFIDNEFKDPLDVVVPIHDSPMFTQHDPEALLSIIPSHISVNKTSNLPENLFSRLLKPFSDSYDFCLVDTHPGFIDLVRVAWHAADLIIIPVELQDQFAFDCSLDTRDELLLNNEKYLEKYYILYNFYSTSRKSQEFEPLYSNEHTYHEQSHIMKTTFPNSQQIKDFLLRGLKLKDTQETSVLWNCTSSFANECVSLTQGACNG